MRRIALSAVLFLTSGCMLNAAESKVVSEVLKKTSELMRERKYQEARQLVSESLEKEKESHRLWLAMGYISEADGKYQEALQAFYEARKLKADSEGLKERIAASKTFSRALQRRQLPTQKPPKHLPAPDILSNQATPQKGLVEFVKAVYLDRSLIGSEQEMIDLGLKFFSNPENLFTTEEKTCYLGFYSFFAGNYTDARRELTDYVTRFPEGSEVARARQQLDEINQLEEQLRAMKTPAKTPAKPPVKQVEKKPEEKPGETAAETAPETTKLDGQKSGEEVPVYVQTPKVDEYAGMDSAQLYSEAMGLAERRPLKAIGLLGRAIKEGNAEPQYYQSLADLYASRKGFEKEAISTYRAIMEKFPGTVAASDAKRKILQMNPSAEQRAKEVFEHFQQQQ